MYFLVWYASSLSSSFSLVFSLFHLPISHLSVDYVQMFKSVDLGIVSLVLFYVNIDIFNLCPFFNKLLNSPQLNFFQFVEILFVKSF